VHPNIEIRAEKTTLIFCNPQQSHFSARREQGAWIDQEGGAKVNLQNWKMQAREHWKEFQPTAFKHQVQTKTLQKALDEAAELTFQEMSQLLDAGMSNQDASEMVREKYLFPPEEAAMKAKNDRAPVASEAARTFNSIARLKSALTED
jgi:hypothetical protein